MDATVDPDLEETLGRAYVQYTAMEAAVGSANGEPNKPCGCGSGKKTKKCCGNPVTTSKTRARLRNLSLLLCSTH